MTTNALPFPGNLPSSRLGQAFRGAAWFVWSRHRPVLILMAAIYLVLLLGSVMLPEVQIRPYLDGILVFLRATAFFLPLAMFVSTRSVITLDLVSNESNFPKQFLALPLTSRQMVLPLMTFAVLVSAALWALAIYISDWRVLMEGPSSRPREQATFQYWFPFFITSLLTWAQALIWMPMRRRWTRPAVLLGLVLAYAVMLVIGASHTFPGDVMTTLSVVQFPLAYVVAAWGVSRARQGEPTPSFTPRTKSSHLPRSWKNGFDAQLWYDTTVHRWSGNTAMLVLAPFALLQFGLLLLNSHSDDPARVQKLAGQILSLLIFGLAAFAFTTGLASGGYEKKTRWYQNDAFRMPTFFAALPVSTGELAWIRLRATATNMLSVCAITLGASLVLLWLSGALDFVRAGLLQTVLSIILMATGIATSWLCLSLVGRAWNWINWSLALGTTISVIGWIQLSKLPGAKEALLAVIPPILQALALAKVLAVSALSYYVLKQGLFTAKRLTGVAVFWLVTMGTLAMTLRSPLSGNFSEPATLLSLVIVMAPVLGIVAAPIALQLNRTH